MLDDWNSDSRPTQPPEASWLGASVRALTEAYPEECPEPEDGEASIVLAESSLSVEELEAIALEPEEASIECGEVTLSVDDLEAIDAADCGEAMDGGGDLAPLRSCFERGDYFGVLVRGEALLESRPGLKAAVHYVTAAREALRRRYVDKLGSHDQIPRSCVPSHEIMSMSLDHREAFLLSLIDGVSSIEEIVDMSGMPQLDVLCLLHQMSERGLVVLGAPR